MTSIALVDPSKHGALIERLQRRTLPYDVPAPTDRGWWWLAVDGGIPVAYAGLYRSVRWADTAYLCRAGVLPSHRGQGLQRRLIAARARKARAIGMSWLITDTNDNPRSANSLIGSGFKLFAPSKPWAADGALYWRKRIA